MTVECSPCTPKMDPTDKAIYKFVSVLPLRSKVFEKMVYEQLYEYLNNCLNELLSGFCKAQWNQHTLFRLIHSWKKSWSVQVWWTLCTLLKASDSLSHDLLIAKLKAYGLDNKAQNWSESKKISIYDSWKISTAEIWSFNRANNVKESDYIELVGISADKHLGFKK